MGEEEMEGWGEDSEEGAGEQGGSQGRRQGLGPDGQEGELDQDNSQCLPSGGRPIQREVDKPKNQSYLGSFVEGEKLSRKMQVLGKKGSMGPLIGWAPLGAGQPTTKTCR